MGMPNVQNENARSIYAGILFLTCGALLFEISLIRLFSVAQWYHFAFLVVSIAMLGLGAAGSFLTVFPQWRQRLSVQRLSLLGFGFASAVIAAYALSNQIPFDQQRISWDGYQFLYLFLYYCVLATPMFFVGLALSALYAGYSHAIGKLYFFDLLGAAIGAVAVLPASTLAGGLGGIWLAAICGAASGFLFAPGLFRGVTAFAFAAVVSALWLFEPAILKLKMSEYKALPQLLLPPQARIVHTEWTPAARIDVVRSPLVHFAPGLSLRRQAALPQQLGLVIDGGNLNAVTEFDGSPRSLAFVDNLPAALPYHLTTVDSMLVCEPLGGLDFLTALYFAVSQIEGVGIYNRAATIVAEKFNHFSGGLFRDFDINTAEMSPRAFLKQTSQRYDLICLPISDSFGAASTGIYGPSEDYLFTVESFTELLHHLTENGWLYLAGYLLPPLRQELRFTALAVRALEESGRQDPESHLIAIRTLETFSLLVKRSPINAQEIARLKAFCSARGFDVVYYPGITANEVNRFNRFPQPIVHEAVTAIIQQSSRAEFYRNYLFDVRPTTDDRPFFGHFFRLDKLKEEFESLAGRWTAFLEGGYLVAAAFVQACLLGLVFVLLPLLARTPHIFSIPSRKNALRGLAYFFSIGMGYMLVEIVLIQRFILFLDHPIYAASAVIGSLLVSSACGSYLSSKLMTTTWWRAGRHLLLLALVLVLIMFWLPAILIVGIGHSLTIRYVTAILLVSIPGVLMGFPFPAGIRQLGKLSGNLVPWGYGANSIASIVGSSLAVLVALEAGFTWVMATAVCFYLLAAVTNLGEKEGRVR